MSFETNRSGALLWHTSTLFDAGAVCHGFSTRARRRQPRAVGSLNLGVGRGDTAENVQENFRRFCAAVGTDPMRRRAQQAGTRAECPPCDRGGRGQGPLARARLSECGRDDLQHAEPAARRLFRRLPASSCCTTRCTQPVGAVHAGWRGAAQGLVSIALRRMGEVFGTHPADVRAAIGAGIGPVLLRDGWGCAAGHARRARRGRPSRISSSAARSGHVDLKGINAHWLRADGVEQIDVCAHCTACRPDLYWVPSPGWATRAARRSP